MMTKDAGRKKNRAVFHVDEMGKWALALHNVENFLKAEPDARLVVVANAEAVKGFADKALLPGMKSLADRGVLFEAHRNALTANNVYPESADWLKIVPAGVVELAVRQGDGYAYIRP
jgi:intracellular sulfur oxidation DsrE/DsrF family protein